MTDCLFKFCPVCLADWRLKPPVSCLLASVSVCLIFSCLSSSYSFSFHLSVCPYHVCLASIMFVFLVDVLNFSCLSVCLSTVFDIFFSRLFCLLAILLSLCNSFYCFHLKYVYPVCLNFYFLSFLLLSFNPTFFLISFCLQFYCLPALFSFCLFCLLLLDCLLLSVCLCLSAFLPCLYALLSINLYCSESVYCTLYICCTAYVQYISAYS